MTPRLPQPLQPDPNKLLNAALDLAGRGIPVFPCAPGAKHPITAHGLHDASLDPARIRAWWWRTPTANLAIPTGNSHGISTFDVLDVDVRRAGSGFPAMHLLLHAGLLDGAIQTVATPGHGRHVYFPGTDQASSRLPGQYLDFKAGGGYVLAPPSVVNGRAYELLVTSSGQPQALAWESVWNLLVPEPQTSPRPARTPRLDGNIEVLAAWVARLSEGERNTGTFWAACRAAEHGYTDLSPIVEAAMSAGLSSVEASRTVASAIRTNQPPPHRPQPPGRGPSPRPPRR